MTGSLWSGRSCPEYRGAQQCRFVAVKPVPAHKEFHHRCFEGRKDANVMRLIRPKCITRAKKDSSHGATESVFPKGFDLPTALALAGCSFRAYLDPKKEGTWTRTPTKEITATYTPSEIQSANWGGFLEVAVKSATGLPARDITGKSDPYVDLSTSESFKQTKMCFQTLEPKWNETFSMTVRDLEKEVLKIRVKDADFLKVDDELGTATYPVKDLKDGKVVDLDLDLKGDGGGGVLSISARYISFEDYILAEESKSTSESKDLQESLLDIRKSMPWRKLAYVAGRKAGERFDAVCYLENKKTDTQVWLHRSDDRERKEAVIAFRGTEITKFGDILTDVNMLPAAFDIERTDKQDLIPKRLFMGSSQELLVHMGFLKAYDSIKQSVFTVLDDVIGDGNGWTVYVTGHSMGGALATLCSYELASRRSFLGKVEMYNYGSPRVGNESFAKAFHEVVSVSWRIANQKDLVATVPKVLGYKHVQNLVQLDGDGILHFGLDTVDESDDINIDLKKTGQLGSEVGTLAEIEKGIIKGIRKGSRVAYHEQDKYLLGMLKCVSLTSFDIEE